MQTRSHVKSLGKLLIVLGMIITLVSGLGVAATISILLFANMSDEDIAMAFTAVGYCAAIF